MIWYVCTVLSLLSVVTALVFFIVKSRRKYKKGRFLTPARILLIGVACAAFFLFLPVYVNFFKSYDCRIGEPLLLAVHSMLRLFIVDGEFELIAKNMIGIPDKLYHFYTMFFALVFVAAPLFTFGVVLSFFKNLSAYFHYFANYNSDLYIFSELNEKSLALAESLYREKKRHLCVFTDVFKSDSEKSFEMREKVKEINGICFNKDIAAMGYKKHSKNSEISFFTIGDDCTENVIQAISIIEKLRTRQKTKLYVFSSDVEAEILINGKLHPKNEDKGVPKAKMEVRCINEIRSLVLKNLYDTGYEKLFKAAKENEKGKKEINALVVGMGHHGTEMVKALTWFCQMDGYEIRIHAVDCDNEAETKFASMCPELMSPGCNGNFSVEGEAAYEITVHSGINVETEAFDRLIERLYDISYVFVCLGDDEKNIAVSMKIRSLYERIKIRKRIEEKKLQLSENTEKAEGKPLSGGKMPVIQSVVYNSEKNEALDNVIKVNNGEYYIDFIGDIKSLYSADVIIASKLEGYALDRHLFYAKKGKTDRNEVFSPEDEEKAKHDFWRYSYNYNSSLASAIHFKMKVCCGIPGADKPIEDRTETEKNNLRMLEHCRWNAYIRSEGFSYSGSTEAWARDNTAKLHNCLVPYKDLPEDKKKNDDFFAPGTDDDKETEDKKRSRRLFSLKK